MKELVFLLEENSAKALLDALLPRILNHDTVFRCIPFEGKQDLEKRLVRKIRGYRNPQARFIVLRDQDSHHDCRQLKNQLLDLCRETGKAEKCLVRIACRELETFYLADLEAVEQAMGLFGLAKQQQIKKFRNPDALGSPSQELRTLTRKQYQKVGGSRAIAEYLNLENGRSPSFRNLVGAIRRMELALSESSHSMLREEPTPSPQTQS